MSIWHLGFTEMFNNAMDHSGGTLITVQVQKAADYADMWVLDNGVGIFRKIQNALGLTDERHAVLELSKGKLTTDPARHSGEGIFFTSRMFDRFVILSGGTHFSHNFGEAEDWIQEMKTPLDSATGVYMELQNHTADVGTPVSGQAFSRNFQIAGNLLADMLPDILHIQSIHKFHDSLNGQAGLVRQLIFGGFRDGQFQQLFPVFLNENNVGMVIDDPQADHIFSGVLKHINVKHQIRIGRLDIQVQGLHVFLNFCVLLFGNITDYLQFPFCITGHNTGADGGCHTV
jgi:hypothetical protein